MKLNLVTLAVIVIGLSLFGMHAAHQPWTAWRIAGIAIAAPAFLLFVAARIELGRAFSVQAKATTLVTTGVYSRIRNPIYIFGALAFLGEFLALGWYIGSAIFVLMNLTQYFRIRREEKVLSEAFGDEYRTYKASTWF